MAVIVDVLCLVFRALKKMSVIVATNVASVDATNSSAATRECRRTRRASVGTGLPDGLFSNQKSQFG
jgi:hypothetical protein